MKEIEPIQAYWDAETRYWNNPDRLLPLRPLFKKRWLEYGLTPEMSILEVAAGVRPQDYYPDFISPRQIVSLDISMAMLRLNQTGTRILGDARRTLPFRQDSFEVVSCIFGLRYFENQEEVVNEMYRVLQPKGLFLVFDFDAVNNGEEVRKFNDWEIGSLFTRLGGTILEEFPVVLALGSKSTVGGHFIIGRKG